jgi:flavin-dependent thymidylate synthase
MTDVTRYVDGSMFPAEPMWATLPTVKIVSATPDPLGVIAAVCLMYQGKSCWNTAMITDDERRHYWEQMKKTTLDTPLEFVNIHLLVEGVTRAWTHQAVRQRTARYAQESLRFAVVDDMADRCQMPPSIAVLPQRDQRRLTWGRAMADAQLWYHTLIENGIPAEDARGVLPHAVTTRMHYASDLRNLRREVAKRTCTQAQFEWRHYVVELRRALSLGVMTVEQFPQGDAWQWDLIVKDMVKPPCFAAGHCTFNASFDRPCSIKDKVDNGKFDQIDELEYLADPRAAWAVNDE